MNTAAITQQLSAALGVSEGDIQISGPSLFLDRIEVGISEASLKKGVYRLKVETKNFPCGVPIIVICRDCILGFLSADTVRRRSSALKIRFALDELRQIREINHPLRITGAVRGTRQRSPR